MTNQPPNVDHNDETKFLLRFGQNVKIIHFIGATKPWLVGFDSRGEPLVGKMFFSLPRADVAHLNFLAGSTSPVPVCTVSPRHWVNKADTQ